MSNEMMTHNDHVPFADGFDDCDAGETNAGIIKGPKLKFDNGKWIAAEEVIASDRKFLVMEIARCVQKWVPGKVGPADTIMLAPDQPFPDVNAMNEACPRSEWDNRFEKDQGPWQAARIVYLLDPTSMSMMTFVSPVTTIGSDRAVRELRDSVRVARKVHGPNHHPIVTLSDTHMPTRFGGRQRPYFKVAEFVPIGGDHVVPQLTGKANGGAA